MNGIYQAASQHEMPRVRDTHPLLRCLHAPVEARGALVVMSGWDTRRHLVHSDATTTTVCITPGPTSISFSTLDISTSIFIFLFPHQSMRVHRVCRQVTLVESFPNIVRVSFGIGQKSILAVFCVI